MLEQCDALVDALVDAPAGGILDPAVVDPSLVDHVGTCLRCQAELARHHRLLRILGDLRREEVALPPSLLADVLDAVGRAATRSVVRATLSRRRVRSALGIAGAAALVAFIVAVERLRAPSRRRARAGLDRS